MKKAFLLVTILFISVISTACINNLAVQELNNKAKAYMDKGDYENAISRLKSSLDLDASVFETQYNLAIAYGEDAQYDNALETFKNAVKIRPEFADTYYSMAVFQENYANDILSGVIKNKDADDEEDVFGDAISDETAADDLEKKVEITEADREKAIALYNDAILSYENFIKYTKNEQDSIQARNHIEKLKSEIEKNQNPASTSAKNIQINVE